MCLRSWKRIRGSPAFFECRQNESENESGWTKRPSGCANDEICVLVGVAHERLLHGLRAACARSAPTVCSSSATTRRPRAVFGCENCASYPPTTTSVCERTRARRRGRRPASATRSPLLSASLSSLRARRRRTACRPGRGRGTRAPREHSRCGSAYAWDAVASPRAVPARLPRFRDPRSATRPGAGCVVRRIRDQRRPALETQALQRCESIEAGLVVVRRIGLVRFA